METIDRPLASFINANTKPEWVLGAKILATASILVPFLLLLALVFHYIASGEDRRARDRIFILVISTGLAIVCVEIIKVSSC